MPEYIEEAARIGPVQIIVFPEGYTGYYDLAMSRETVTPYCVEVPDVGGELPSVNPCDSKGNYSDQLSRVSCYAREYGVVIVTNICEYKSCSNFNDPYCPPDAHYQFNTNLVFSSNGDLIATYRKSHEAGHCQILDQPHTPDYTTFTTPFGITFATFVCADLQYVYPPLEYVRNGIKHFVHTTDTPGGTTYSVPMLLNGWSLTNQVNIIQGNAETSGIGIYSAGTPLVSAGPFVYDTSKHMVIVSQLPVTPTYGFQAAVAGSAELHFAPLQPPTRQESLPAPTHDRVFGLPVVAFNISDFSAVAGAQGSASVSLTYKNYGTISCYVSYSVLKTIANTTASGGDKYALAASLGYFEEQNTIDNLANAHCLLGHCPGGKESLCTVADSVQSYTPSSWFASAQIEATFPAQWASESSLFAMAGTGFAGQPIGTDFVSLQKTTPSSFAMKLTQQPVDPLFSFGFRVTYFPPEFLNKDNMK
eukprot:TRINITY_DN6163_c0_g1_i1.p1 TRINITY_DN6163_c0_g1~~TRINITY_DN6163_c0_g1_i1.p1  ORF type:complete len:538 (+),score=91.67 TRINITY_DN6163_c0_g1_i1:189-1616(+)